MVETNPKVEVQKAVERCRVYCGGSEDGCDASDGAFYSMERTKGEGATAMQAGVERCRQGGLGDGGNNGGKKRDAGEGIRLSDGFDVAADRARVAVADAAGGRRLQRVLVVWTRSGGN